MSFTALGLINVVESIMKSSSRKIRSVIDEELKPTSTFDPLLIAMILRVLSLL